MKPKPGIEGVPLTWAQVAMWRLGRHYLIDRAERQDLLEVTSRICGLQAQVMSSAELTASARREGGMLKDVSSALWEDRTLVKMWAMRGTLHLLNSEDLPLYIRAMQSRQGYKKASWLKYFNTTVEDMEAFIEGVHDALDGKCLTRQELAREVVRVTGRPHFAEQLTSSWGTFLKPAAFMGYLAFGPSKGQNVTFVRPDQWLGVERWPAPDEVESRKATAELLRRYLAAYGPATAHDFALWFGSTTSMNSAFKDLGDALVEVDVEGLKAYALHESVPDIQAQNTGDTVVRLLGGFDPYTIAMPSPQRAYLLPEGTLSRVSRIAGWISPVVLVNGYVRGVWNHARGRTELAVTVELFGSEGKDVTSGIELEAERLADMLGGPLELKFDTVVFGGRG